MCVIVAVAPTAHGLPHCTALSSLAQFYFEPTFYFRRSVIQRARRRPPRRALGRHRAAPDRRRRRAAALPAREDGGADARRIRDAAAHTGGYDPAPHCLSGTHRRRATFERC